MMAHPKIGSRRYERETAGARTVPGEHPADAVRRAFCSVKLIDWYQPTGATQDGEPSAGKPGDKPLGPGDLWVREGCPGWNRLADLDNMGLIRLEPGEVRGDVVPIRVIPIGSREQVEAAWPWPEDDDA